MRGGERESNGWYNPVHAVFGQPAQRSTRKWYYTTNRRTKWCMYITSKYLTLFTTSGAPYYSGCIGQKCRSIGITKYSNFRKKFTASIKWRDLLQSTT